ncbi:helix-turn-helix transcriptional regulator [Kitasatospora albolonga]|uniref:helix-turn-helix transcriptional regulator n=1 Tax=Kitasatospora albolonga TaxID=68173 RepID=UPI0035F0E06D
MKLYGREREQAELAGRLAGARAGRGSALVLWGEPGIGKSALMERAAAGAEGFTVLGCRGSRMESGLAFAALHGMLWPVAGRIDALPEPQAVALRGVLGQGRAGADHFLVYVAVLTLLSELAAERPLVLLVDDAAQLDDSTAACLAFVARRLSGTPLAVLIASHTDPAAGGRWEGLPGLAVTGLAEAEAARLVRAGLPEADGPTVLRAVREACGNPLALLELPSLLGESAERLAVGPRLRHAFGVRTAELSAPARSLLLVLAAEDRGDRHLVRRAAAALGLGPQAWEEARRSGLLTAREQEVGFRAPLIGSVVYEAAPFAERQAAHRALAAALGDGPVHGGLRAWHLAAAADRPDESVAGLLEDAAHQDRAGGGGASATRALLRAAELSPSPSDAGRRLALGALSAWESGQVERAGELLDRAGQLVPDELVAEASGGLAGLAEFAHGDQESAHRLLLRDSRTVSEPSRALELAALSMRAGWAAGSPERQAAGLARVNELTREGGSTEAVVLAELAPWWGTGGSAGPVLTDEAVARLGAVCWRLVPPGPIAVAWGAERPVAEAFARKLAELRRGDAASALVLTVPQTATLDIVSGRWETAAANAAATLRLAEEIGAGHAASQCRNSLAWLAALRGDDRSVSELTSVTLELSVPRRVRALTAAAYWNQGQAALYAGRAEEALERLVRLAEPGHQAAHPTFALLAAADTVEAAVRAGRPEAGAAAFATLASWARRTGVAWAVAAAHRSAAVLDGRWAQECFERALAVPGAAERPFCHARTHLLYGEWLRRTRRRARARVHLAEAAGVFRELGAAPLLARACGEQDLTAAQGRPAEEEGGLTAQELRVARLAAEGLTNREIAARLLISPRTVGHHLSNVFAKLGIVARTELARIDFANGLRLVA